MIKYDELQSNFCQIETLKVQEKYYKQLEIIAKAASELVEHWNKYPFSNSRSNEAIELINAIKAYRICFAAMETYKSEEQAITEGDYIC